MKQISTLFVALYLLIASTTSAQNVVVSGVTLPGVLKAGNNSLILNGGGVRVKLFMDMYVGGLYVTTKSTDGNAIAKSNDAGAVRLHITSSLVTTDRMKEAIQEGFKKSTGGNLAPLQARIDKFVNVFSLEPIVKGNEFDVTYAPGEGVKVYKAGKLLQTVEGQDFKAALWGIWLGNDPADKGLKEGMLGLKK